MREMKPSCGVDALLLKENCSKVSKHTLENSSLMRTSISASVRAGDTEKRDKHTHTHTDAVTTREGSATSETTSSVHLTCE